MNISCDMIEFLYAPLIFEIGNDILIFNLQINIII